MDPKEKTILITKIGDINPSIINQLKDVLNNALQQFGLSVKINPISMNIKREEFNSRREQYNGSLILQRFSKFTDNLKSFRDLGVIEEDLYTYNLNFIFGLARIPQNKFQFSGIALIAIKRLREEFYDKPSNENLLFDRILKEALHELGHTFGLEHCLNYCVMRFSNSLSETDGKPQKFCNSCRKQVSDLVLSLS